MKTEIKIQGMHCNSCSMLIKDALMDVKGVKDAKVDWKTGKAVITHDANEKELIAAIKQEGYEVMK